MLGPPRDAAYRLVGGDEESTATGGRPRRRGRGSQGTNELRAQVLSELFEGLIGPHCMNLSRTFTGLRSCRARDGRESEASRCRERVLLLRKSDARKVGFGDRSCRSKICSLPLRRGAERSKENAGVSEPLAAAAAAATAVAGSGASGAGLKKFQAKSVHSVVFIVSALRLLRHSRRLSSSSSSLPPPPPLSLSFSSR